MHNSIVIEDERGYLNASDGPKTIEEIINDPKSAHHVVPHNTMRFDIHMAHIHYLLEEENMTPQQLAMVIKKGIIDAIQLRLNWNPDGSTILNESIMMHREILEYDFS